MYGIDKIDIKNMQIGNYAYSDYTRQYYIVAALPNFIKEGLHTYALIRLDGQGYYYKSDSLDELKDKISKDGGETCIYKNVDKETFKIKKELWYEDDYYGNKFYGNVGEVTPFLMEKQYLQVGDIVETSRCGKSCGESYVVKYDNKYFIMGIKDACDDKKGIIHNWDVNIVKKFHEVNDLEKYGSVRMRWLETKVEKTISDFTNEELILELQKRMIPQCTWIDSFI